MKRPPFVTVVAILALVPLLVPTVIVLIASFSAGDVITFPPQGLTVDWYREMVDTRAIWSSLGHSLYVSLLSVVINVLCGVPAGLALPRLRRGMRGLFLVLISLGLSSPTIVTAFAYFDLYRRVGLSGSLTGVAVVTAVASFPFMLWTILAAVDDQDPHLVPAAATMGSDPVEQLLFVRLPLLAPGIVTGGLIVFVLSFTDFVIAQVLVTIDNQTLPVYIYAGMRDAISPALGAASALFILVAASAFLVVLRFGNVEKFLFRR